MTDLRVSHLTVEKGLLTLNPLVLTRALLNPKTSSCRSYQVIKIRVTHHALSSLRAKMVQKNLLQSKVKTSCNSLEKVAKFKKSKTTSGSPSSS